jgi:asparagine synthase (glutamine-hydrolysing)
MSAICGIVQFDGRPVDPAALRGMVDSSPYRGPDGVRYLVVDNAGFAFLAFDVTPESVLEAQPWKDPETGVVLVADARIDNREELDAGLKMELTRLKPLLQDAGPAHERAGLIPDSLYILAAWHKWGKSCVARLLGDFVFAIWDASRQALFVARDSLGGHSVSWHQSKQTFAFASETSAILDLPFVDARISDLTVAKVLAHVPRGAEETFFESVHYLPAAHALSVNTDRLDVERYWDIDPAHRIEYATEGEYAEHFLDLVNRAVHCRMRSRKPVGVALSGGHDSSLLAACASRLQAKGPGVQGPIRSYSYIFERHPKADERPWIDAVVNHCGLEPEYVLADGMWTFKDLNKRPVPRDYLWTNCYVQLPESMARAAGQAGCALLIDGQFGDALCSGRSPVAAQMLQQGRIAELCRLLWRAQRDVNWREELIECGIRPLLSAWLQGAWRTFIPRKRKPFVAGLEEGWVQRLQSEAEGGYAFGIMNQLAPDRKKRYGYLMNASWPRGLAAARGMTYNRHGVERVAPFFDRRIVEFVMAIPTDQVASPGKYRRLQTNALKRVLPPLVYQRREKASFDSLLREGLLDRERATVRRLLENPEMVRQGWVRQDWLEAQFATGDGWDMAGYPFSMCLHLELWLRAVSEAGGTGAKWASPYTHRPR